MIDYRRLPNGLRVVLSPFPASGMATATAFYRAGFRDEAPGLAGLAHLIEHLAAQGSRSLAKLEHKARIDAAGGFYYGMTRSDYTTYINIVPAQALDVGLFTLADEMAGLRPTEATLRNQVDVVKEEIRVNILDTPYRGFPWFQLPELAFDTFANRHDGYGGFGDLDRITLDDVTGFLDRFYHPGNAVLSVAGDFDADAAWALVDKYFGELAPGGPANTARHAEFEPTADRDAELLLAGAPTPALAVGLRAPDPTDDFAGYLHTHVLCHLLTDGAGARLHRRLVTPGLATSVQGALGNLGEWLGTLGPTLLFLAFHHAPGSGADAILAAVDDELEAVATGLDGPAATRAARIVGARFTRGLSDTEFRANATGLSVLLYDEPDLVDTVTKVFATTDAAALRRAAAGVLRRPKAVQRLLPKETR